MRRRSSSSGERDHAWPLLRQSRSWKAAGWVLLGLVPLSGCGKKTVVARDAEAAKTLPVATATATSRMIPVILASTGNFVAEESSNVAPPVAGRIIRTPVAIGAYVRQGQVLAELDHRDAELKLSQLRAQLAESNALVKQAQSRIGLEQGAFDPARVPEVAAARANYESSEAQAKLAAADAKRFANLNASGDVSASVYEKARTQAETSASQASASRQQYQSALNTARQGYQAIGSSQASNDAVRVQVAQAEKGVADTFIHAPFDGYVSARPVAVGEYVAATNTVATVVRINMLKLELQVPEKSAAGLRVGMPVTARVAAYLNRDFSGVTSAVNPSINPDSRAFVLEAQFQNADNVLRPGMFATAKVQLPGEVNAVFVPAASILRDRTTDSNQVYVVSGGKAHLRVVALGDRDGTSVRVVSGVAAGETVATEMLTQLYEGAPVETRPAR